MGVWAEEGKEVDRGDGDGIIENDLFVVIIRCGVIKEKSKKERYV